LFSLSVVREARVEISTAEDRVVRVLTDDGWASAGPLCWVSSTTVKENVTTHPRDIRYGETGIAVVWH
jgi:transposase